MRLVTLKLPLRIVDDDDLLRVSEANPGYQFEREADRTLTVSATHADSGAQSAEAVYQLKVYAKRCGGRVFDSSTGFRIGRAVKSPDAAWVSAANVARLAVERRPGFWPERPDVAIEIRSASDSFAALVRKLHFYVKNGTRFAVAVDPMNREVVELGTPPKGLAFEYGAIIEA